MIWSNIPSLSALRAFEAAARRESLTKAAAELNVTHAAIAQHVRALEAEFNVGLLTRQGRGVVPTKEGQRLALALASGFQEIAAGVEDLRKDRAERPINVSVTPSFATNWLMPRLGGFWALHPDIVVNISPSVRAVDLRGDNFDLAIRFGDGNWPNLEVTALTGGDYWAVVHPDLAKGRRMTCLKDVLDLPWLLENHLLERKQLIEAEGVDLADVKIRLFDLNSLVTAAVLAGLGITIQPKSLVEAQVASGALHKICELHQPNLGYYIVTTLGDKSQKLKAFMKWLSAVAKDEPEAN